LPAKATPPIQLPFTTNAFVATDACRAIDLDGSLAAAIDRMQVAGVGLIPSTEILG
jgi:nicotinamidase/pyrazinamidase